MTEKIPRTLKANGEDLTLHATPRLVTRLNRKVLIGIAGLGASVVALSAFYALDPQRQDQAQREELYNVGNAERAAGLQTLPKSYQDIPKIGAPLPGELGRAVLRAEREAGIREPLPPQSSAFPFQSSPEVDAARAERLRRAQIAQAAMEAGVFFQLSGTDHQTPSAEPEQFSTDSLASLNPFFANLSPNLEGKPGLMSDQNDQDRKTTFLNDKPDADIYNPHALQDPVSPFQIMAGSVIAASLITGINSDLPGMVIGQVTEPVFDSVSGQYLLIPQGTRLIGKYDSLIAFGQERALVVWQRLIMPDGSSVVIDNLPGTDGQGYAGFADKVSFHTWRLIKGIALSTLLNVGTELAFDESNSDLSRALERSTQDTIGRTGQQIVDRNLDIQPTITIRPGWPLRVLVHKDIVLRPYNERGDNP